MLGSDRWIGVWDGGWVDVKMGGCVNGREDHWRFYFDIIGRELAGMGIGSDDRSYSLVSFCLILNFIACMYVCPTISQAIHYLFD